MKLEGKLAVLTGGARGIGYAIAKRFLEKGGRVVVLDINGETAEVAARDLSTGGEAMGGQLDVRDWGRCRQEGSGDSPRSRQDRDLCDLRRGPRSRSICRYHAATMGPGGGHEPNRTLRLCSGSWAAHDRSGWWGDRQYLIIGCVPRHPRARSLQLRKGRCGGADPSPRFRVGSCRSSRQRHCSWMGADRPGAASDQ